MHKNVYEDKALTFSMNSGHQNVNIEPTWSVKAKGMTKRHFKFIQQGKNISLHIEKSKWKQTNENMNYICQLWVTIIARNAFEWKWKCSIQYNIKYYKSDSNEIIIYDTKLFACLRSMLYSPIFFSCLWTAKNAPSFEALAQSWTEKYLWFFFSVIFAVVLVHSIGYEHFFFICVVQKYISIYWHLYTGTRI